LHPSNIRRKAWNKVGMERSVAESGLASELARQWRVGQHSKTESAMAEEKITTKRTEVRVEKHSGTDAKATVKKDGAGGSATAPTMQEAVDRAGEQSKK
jgi:hypothetical protein